MSKSFLRISLMLFCLLLASFTAWAAEQPAQSPQAAPTGQGAAAPIPQTERNLPNTPRATPPERSTMVSVEHEGTDALGIKLAFQIKELFNNSSLFELSDSKDAAKVLKVMLSSAAEFEGRPNIGSAYALVWVFSDREGTIGYYLAREVGVVMPEDIPALAAKIVARTDGMAARYDFLFKK